MTIDDFLFYVPKKWYQFYWVVLTIFSSIIVLSFTASLLVPGITDSVRSYGISGGVACGATLVLAYLLGPYWYIRRRSMALASLIGNMLTTFIVFYALSAAGVTSGTSLPYVGALIVMMTLTGMYGFPIVMGAFVVISVFILASYNFNVFAFSPYSWALLAGSLGGLLWDYPLWKQRFINKQEQQVHQLSGLLRSNQQQSEIFIRSITDGVIGMDTTGKITLMNPAAAKLTEWPIDEAVGVDVKAVVTLATEAGADLEADNNPFATALKDQEAVHLTLQLKGRNDTATVVSLIVTPIIEPSNNTLTGAVAVIRDISEEHAAEKQRGEFISTASHEMRTPVAAIEGYLALALNEKVSTIDQRARSYLEKAHNSTQHLGKLFQDLLTSSKAEDGRLANHPTAVEMGAFMQQLSDDLKFSAEKKGLFSEFLIGSSDAAVDATSSATSENHVVKPFYYVNVDPDRMREVLTNLFDNACKYTDQGKITLGLTGDNDVVQVYIRDTGPGIPAADIPHLFQKFYRVDNSATRTIGGTGLGLFICRKIVELYRGRIWAESVLGKGSSFFINLPRISTTKANELLLAEANNTPGVQSAS
jgi:PAS domain S-box-containing protein